MRASRLLGRVVPKAAVAIYSIFVGAQVEAQTVTATPTRGEEGSLVVVSGTGWPRDDSVDISWQTKVSYVISSVPTDSGGNFIATLVVPKGAQGGPSVFSKKGLQDSHNIPVLAGVSFNVQADSLSRADAYFIGLHGTGEGPDGDNQSLSTVIGETWRYFHDAAVRLNHNNVRGYAVDFAGSALAVLAGAAPGIGLVVSAAEDGKNKLTDLVNHIIEKNCRNPVVVLAGYSLRAWAIDRWISENYSVKLGISAPLPYVIDLVRGITLYGDPMWLHGDLGGVARRSGQTISSDPYTSNPPGYTGKLANKWQSRCLANDPVCGEGYPIGEWTILNSVYQDFKLNSQRYDTVMCAIQYCEHKKYAVLPEAGKKGSGSTKDGGEFLASQLFYKSPRF